MFNKFMTIVVFVPLAIILVALAVANRAAVPFTIDPFNPGSAGLTVTMPLFVYIFAALVLGLIVGSLATWLRQGRYRKLARRNQDLQEQPKPKAPHAAATSTALVRNDG
jgi:uncharacterized integral membrane protein